MISVVMPVYNGERHLAEAIESVLGQSESDFEFIIVDDGSTDSSPAIIARFAEADRRIRVIRQPNAGGAAARNAGIAAASREYVAMLDQDDVALGHRLAAQLAAARSHPEVLLWSGWATKISDDGRELGTYAVGPTTIAEYDSYRRRSEAMLLHGPAFFARRDVFVRAGGYIPELALVDDTDLANRVAEFGPVLALPEVVNRHRYHETSATFAKFFRQADLAGYVWARTEARARGADLTLEEYERAKSDRSPIRRLRDRAFIRSRYHFRRGGIAVAGGHRAGALGHLAASALCYPPYFVRRALEMARGGSDAQEQGIALPAAPAQGRRTEAAAPPGEL